jgi:hypothetical protein
MFAWRRKHERGRQISTTSLAVSDAVRRGVHNRALPQESTISRLPVIIDTGR